MWSLPVISMRSAAPCADCSRRRMNVGSSNTPVSFVVSKRSREPSTPQDFLKVFNEMPLEFEPASKFRYNNSGYFLLGAIIEKVAGKPYDDQEERS